MDAVGQGRVRTGEQARARRLVDEDFTVTGTLSPAPAAAIIRLVYTPPGGTPFARTTVADASGNWSRTLDPNADHGDGTTFGSWTVQGQFDGAPGFEPSQSSTCSVTVSDS